MNRRVIDLTAEELERLASEAWSEAARNALRAGAPIVGREGGKIVKTYPDGRSEILEEAAPLHDIGVTSSENMLREKRREHLPGTGEVQASQVRRGKLRTDRLPPTDWREEVVAREDRPSSNIKRR